MHHDNISAHPSPSAVDPTKNLSMGPCERLLSAVLLAGLSLLIVVRGRSSENLHSRPIFFERNTLGALWVYPLFNLQPSLAPVLDFVHLSIVHGHGYIAVPPSEC